MYYLLFFLFISLLSIFKSTHFIVAESDGKSINSRTNNTNTNTNTNNTNNNSNNSLIAHITSLPGFDPTKARIVKHLSLKSCQIDYIQSQQKEYSALDLLPTAAETLLPWRRDKSYQCIGTCFRTKRKIKWNFFFY